MLALQLPTTNGSSSHTCTAVFYKSREILRTGFCKMDPKIRDLFYLCVHTCAVSVIVTATRAQGKETI